MTTVKGIKSIVIFSVCLSFCLSLQYALQAQHSVAREWNEALLAAIRNDLARPTVHARNLFHTSIAMYDTWAVFNPPARTYLLGNTVGNFRCTFDGFESNVDDQSAVEEAMSYAVYRLLVHRFENAPKPITTLNIFDEVMTDLGYDNTFTETDYTSGNPAALGNYIAQCVIAYGLQDGANEENDYANQVYEPVNPPLFPDMPGNPDIVDPNRWQPLWLDVFIDQSGNPFPANQPEFQSPEWGEVVPFALNASDRIIKERDGTEWKLYVDPTLPPQIDEANGDAGTENYQWGFSLVSVWSAHLDPADGVMWDISPGSIGNIQDFPTSFDDYQEFYQLLDGGDPGQGHDVNPATGAPYPVQMVPRADYARVLAEFWADGPDSETPPGHWYTILNYVSDHPELEKKFKGEGEELNDLEWDVKAYFVLGGAVHDAAVAAWSAKGYYDYIRPISAIRSMADRGQSSDPNGVNYHPAGIPLIDNYIELVESGDPLAGSGDENVGKIKVYAWRGPDYIDDPETDLAGVGWILAENWWPYQRPSFVTPPFAGYVSGHSTFSRAAAEVLTLFTGDAFFPGGVGEFVAEKDEFLVFEEGPSVDVVLQWATYRDASDQTSLSRIWGGIHPPADDIPGRLMGEQIGVDAFEMAETYFEGFATGLNDRIDHSPVSVLTYPNPSAGGPVSVRFLESATNLRIEVVDLKGARLQEIALDRVNINQEISLSFNPAVGQGVYVLKVTSDQWQASKRLVLN